LILRVTPVSLISTLSSGKLRGGGMEEEWNRFGFTFSLEMYELPEAFFVLPQALAHLIR
jgi:hypothetical protein